MSRFPRANVFSTLFGIAYTALWLHSEFTKTAMFRYYPVLGRFSTENLPLETGGPAILWYSWLLGAAVISGAAALIVPARWADALGRRVIWVAPAFLLIGILVYERRWFY